MSTLHVFWESTCVGRLTRTGSREATFLYGGEFLKAGSHSPISWSLPLQAEPHVGPHVMAWFANLLPEGEVRSHVSRELGISDRNDFALLEAIGGDCAGALRVMKEAEPEISGGGYRPLPWAELEKRIASFPRPSLLALMQAEGALRLSLAGAQDKLPVHYRDGELTLPEGGASSSHLVKITTGGIPDLVQNEFFCLSLARAVGLPVCRASIAPVRTPILLVERYDRARDVTGDVIRLHQEDFCQALGLGPETKYENEGGPSHEQIFTVLNEASRNPLPDKRELLRLVLFNHLVGNADAHAKNISLLSGRLGETAGPRLAPFYDLVCTRIYEGLDRKSAQRVGGEYRPGRLLRRHWERLAEQIGVKSRYLNAVGLEMATLMTEHAGAVAAGITSAHGAAKTLKKIVGVIERRADRMFSEFK